MRNKSYGQDFKLTAVDKFGVYLSERMVLKHFNRLKKEGMAILDLGCGYQAHLLRKLGSMVSLACGVDVAVSDEVKSVKTIKVYESAIEGSFGNFDSGYFDLVMMINVLEHLSSPLVALRECQRILKNGGHLLINVPTWTGKFFLETSAYVFRLSPESEIDDHKIYFDKKGLWPLLVEAGFKPSQIKLSYHKFGLNLFAACKKI
jgi:SAM-dependent methyltransferase